MTPPRPTTEEGRAPTNVAGGPQYHDDCDLPTVPPPPLSRRCPTWNGWRQPWRLSAVGPSTCGPVSGTLSWSPPSTPASRVMREPTIKDCVICRKAVVRIGSRGPIPKYCSPKCLNKASRTPYRREYERIYRRAERAAGKRKEYERAYYQRPEVKERYRQRWRNLYGDRHANVIIPAPYTGHMWLEKIRSMVGDFDQAMPWADKYNDMVGEGVLAFLEGRDPSEAIDRMRKEYSHAEHRQVYLSAFEKADDNPDRMLPHHYDVYNVEPPEVPPTVSTPIPLETQPRVSWKKNKATRLHAAKRKGGRGPKRSHRRFRPKSYE